MTIPRFVAAVVLTTAGLAAAPAQATGLTIPVQCELGTETVLSWDHATYDLRGTCGVVRVVADDATVTMPSATRLLLDGSGSSVTAKRVYDVEVAGAGNTVSVARGRTTLRDRGEANVLDLRPRRRQ